MEIPRWQRSVTASGSAGGALADPARLVQPQSTLAVLGDMVTREGMELAEATNRRLYNNQMTRFKLETKQALAEMDLGGDPRDYLNKADELMGDLKYKALQRVTHPDAAIDAADWFSNMAIDWRLQVGQKAAREIGKESEQLYEAGRAAAKARYSEEELAENGQRAVENGIPRELVEAHMTADLVEMDINLELQAARLLYDETRDPQKALDFIRSSSKIPEGRKQELQEDLNTEIGYRASYEEAAEKQQIEQARETDRLNILKLRQSQNIEDLKNLPSVIMGSALDAKEQDAEIAKVEARIKALKDGDLDPLKQTDWSVYLDLSRQVENTPDQITEGQLAGYVGRGETGGISVAQYETLRDRLEKNREGDAFKNRLHKRYSGAIDDLQTKGYFNPNKGQNIRLAAIAQNSLDDFTKNNPDAGDQEYMDFFNQIVATRPGWWYRKFRSRAGAQKTESELLELSAKAGTAEDLTQLSDEDLLKRITGGK